MLLPHLLAGFGVECEDVGVERRPVDLAVKKGWPAIDDAAADDARRFRRILDLGLPDLLSGLGVDSHRGAVCGHIEDTVVNKRLRLLAAIVVVAVVPRRDQVFHVVLVDLVDRAKTL
jgi:hypothetical protein